MAEATTRPMNAGYCLVRQARWTTRLRQADLHLLPRGASGAWRKADVLATLVLAFAPGLVAAQPKGTIDGVTLGSNSPIVSILTQKVLFPSSGVGNFVDKSTSAPVLYDAPVSGTTSESNTCYVCFTFGNDNLVSNAPAPGSLISAFLVLDQITRPSAKGSRIASQAQMIINAAPQNGGFFVATQGDALANSTAGGRLAMS